MSSFNRVISVLGELPVLVKGSLHVSKYFQNHETRTEVT